jgi:hypothetical protein
MKSKLCLLLIAALAFSTFAVFPKFAYADPANFSYTYPVVQEPDFAYVGELKPGDWTPWVKVNVTISTGAGETINFSVTQTGGWFAEVSDTGNKLNWPVEAAPGPTYTWQNITDTVTVKIRVQVPTNWTEEGCVTFNVKLYQGYDSGTRPRKTIAPGDGVHFKVCVTIPPPAPSAATISGVKFHDVNANRIRDDGEEGLEGWMIQLWKDGTCVQNTTTGPAGDYTFTVTEAGHYNVTEVLEPGWMQTAPTNGYHEIDVALGGCHYRYRLWQH